MLKVFFKFSENISGEQFILPDLRKSSVYLFFALEAFPFIYTYFVCVISVNFERFRTGRAFCYDS